MELTWGEDFEALAQVARSVFAKDSPLVDREGVVDERDRHRQLVELGWLQLHGAPGSSDGVGVASAAGVFVEMGRALAPSPLPALTRARDLALLIDSPAAAELAERSGDGEEWVVAVPLDERWGEAPVRLESGRLQGCAMAVPHAARADTFLVGALEGDQPAVVRVDARAVEVESMPNLGERPLFAIRCDRAEVRPDDVLARGEAAARAWAVSGRRADVMLAAQVYGAGLRLLDATVTFASQRHQFGGPIGRFQAVQYLCTDIAIDVHLTSAFIRDAARVLDAGGDAELEVALLRRQASRTAQSMVHAAHEVHAGLGFMLESDVHLFTKAAKYWQFELHHATDEHTIVTCLAAQTGVEARRESEVSA